MSTDNADAQPIICMMMAMDRNRLIGSHGQMPWHIPGELAYFKSVTLGKPVIMGRKTFESIGKPLPGRTNVVVTRNADWSQEGVLVAQSLEQGLKMAAEVQPEKQGRELMVIGGAQLCQAAMPMTQRLYLTTVDHAYDGDTWLESFHWDDWQVISKDVRDPATTGGLPVTYWVLEKA